MCSVRKSASQQTKKYGQPEFPTEHDNFSVNHITTLITQGENGHGWIWAIVNCCLDGWLYHVTMFYFMLIEKRRGSGGGREAGREKEWQSHTAISAPLAATLLITP